MKHFNHERVLSGLRFNTVVDLPAADACYHNVCAMNFESSYRKPKKFDSTPHTPRKRRHTTGSEVTPQCIPDLFRMAAFLDIMREFEN